MKKIIAAVLLTFSIITSSGSVIYAGKNPVPGESALLHNPLNNSKEDLAKPEGEDGTAEKKEKGLIEAITYKSIDTYELVYIKTSGYSDFRTEILSNPDRIVIDLENVNVPAGYGSIRADGELVNSIRYSQFTEDAGRVVLDVKKNYDYSIEETDIGLTVYINKMVTAEELRSDNAIVFGDGSGIKMTGIGVNETVSIGLGGYESYSISRLTNPERLVVTMSDVGVIGADKQLDAVGARVSYISYKSYKSSGKSDAVITIGLTAQFQYRVDEIEDELVLSFEWPTYKNIRYCNNQDRVHFLIKNAELTVGTKNLKPLYTHSKNRTGRVYTVTFPSENADISEGILNINDEYLDSLEVRDNNNGTTSLIFTGNPENSYLIFTRESGDTAITVAKPAAADKKLVVIDAGHGGSASGAAYGKLIEKELNLDIAKRMEELLKEQGAETYMIRSDDSNVDNYERAYIANMIGARIFISIHNNGTKSNKTDGTMTLFCPSSKRGFTGRELAQIIQEDMLRMLKTTDRGLRSRPDLIVLRETNMPAVIAEVAFLTNASDRARLMSDDFKQKAAQSLCNSVIKALRALKDVN